MGQELEVRAVTGEELVELLEERVRQMQENKYAFQVKLTNLAFEVDQTKAEDLELAPPFESIDQAEQALGQGVIRPTTFVEYDGTEHQVIIFDPEIVGSSGFMDCVTHSLALTSEGLFEVGHFPAMSLTAAFEGEGPLRYWQWFLHRRLATVEQVKQLQEEHDLSPQDIINRVYEHLTGIPRNPDQDNPLTEPEEPLFPLGQVVATPGALEALKEAGEDPAEFLDRHISGDWGELDEYDREENELSLKEGFRLLSAYRTSKGKKIWIITEADRSATTLLLPEEY